MRFPVEDVSVERGTTTLLVGNVHLTIFVPLRGKPVDIGRTTDSQVLDRETTYVSPGLYKAACTQAIAIIRERRERANRPPPN